jgi:hypothetical protein
MKTNDQTVEPKCWLWPDRTIGKAESRQLREEHNALVNEATRMREALQAILNDTEQAPVGDETDRHFAVIMARARSALTTNTGR